MGIRSMIVVQAGDGEAIDIACYDKTATHKLREQFGWNDGEYSGVKVLDKEFFAKFIEPQATDFATPSEYQDAYQDYLRVADNSFGIEECNRINRAFNNGWGVAFSWG